MTDNQNPYAAPQAKVVEAAGPIDGIVTRLRREPAVLPANAGPEWVGQSWDLFKKTPALLIAMLVLYFVIGMVVEMIPAIGSLFMWLTFGIWGAGWAVTFDKLYRGEEINVGDLFAGFSHPQVGRLFTIGALYLGLFAGLVVLMAVLAVVAFGAGNFSDFGELVQGDTASVTARIAGNLGIFFVLMLVFVTGMFLIFAYIAYAPVLVTMHDIPALDACSLSLRAVLRNWLPMTVYGLILVGLFIASAFTLFLGLLVVVPLMIGVGYVSYRQIFLEE